MFDISIVLITWKMKHYLEDLLTSLIKLSKGFEYEIIVLDNNSQDGTVEMIKEKFPKVNLVQNEVNMGVAPARNKGMKMATGRYVLILDADMKLVDNSFLKMLNYMESDTECGLLGCRLIQDDGELQNSCKRFPTFITLLFRRLEGFNFVRNSKLLRDHIMADWDHNSIREVDYLIGACQFIRKEVVDKIGYYDDNIFYGPEDIDYCLRVWRAGWKVKYFNETSIIHFEQRITKKALFSKISFSHLKGIIYIFKKYGGRLTR